MSQALESTLRNFAGVATLVKDRPYRQVWRFEHAGTPYYLKFYPRGGSAMKRLVRGSPAWREFDRLRWLQRANVPAPRAVAHLVGFTISGTKGDAVILEGIEPSVPLDVHLNDLRLRGERPSDKRHRDLVEQTIDILEQLQDAGLGHGDLHLGNLLLHEGRLVLLDAYEVRRDGLRKRDVQLLAHSARRFCTTTDLLRGWRATGFGFELPRRNPEGLRQWRKLVARVFDEGRGFGRLRGRDGWAGVFFKQTPFPRRWAPVSRQSFTHDDWTDAWPRLLDAVRNDQLEVLKRTRSGDVLAGEVLLGGRPIDVVVKRPRRKFLHRYVTELGRGRRPRRAWRRAWQLIVRDIPTAWPLLMMERRVVGYPVDTVIVYERVRGTLLPDVDLDAMPADTRDTLFRRMARALRLMEQTGLSQSDAKMPNWMIVQDDRLGPVPVVIDVDGIRTHTGDTRAIERLLRSMKDHPQYTPADSLALCQAYAPAARMVREPASEADAPGGEP